ncbi:hypothetical protein N0V94_008495 [Neodidymelliopsis sp. IMI 364377]|nr:hypothetical protein N0V94_008495 [Neodidymelliopsis sp. IMI 364377]
MQLLDLPPEVFQRIIQIYVTDVRIRKAAKSRNVSRTFRDYINDEMFARQPVSAFVRKVPKKLLKKNMALFLTHRVSALHGAPDFLPSVIRKLVSHIMDVIGNSTDKARKSWVQKVITAIALNCDDVVNLAISPTALKCERHSMNAIDINALSVAIYSKDKNLTSKLLEREPDPSCQTRLFGYVPCVAAVMNDIRTAQRLLPSGGGPGQRFRRHLLADVVLNALFIAVRKNHWPLAVIFYHWYETNVERTPDWCRKELIRSAAAEDGLSLLEVVLPFAQAQYQDDLLSGLLASKKPQPVLLHCVQEKRILNWMQVRRSSSEKTRTLLELAVRKRNLPMVKATIAVQTQHSNSSLYVVTTHALRDAIVQNSEDIVRFLLDHGADPEAQIPFHIAQAKKRPVTSTCELARPGSKVYYMVKKAINRKIAKLGEDYQPPKYFVWSKKEQKDVLVAYTYHPPKV